jgi:2'-hydroxyisoflavone reductase
MDLLILGGTAWFGREIAATAIARGHVVTCLARGDAGEVAEGAALLRADRSHPDAYDAVRDRDWDAVIDVSWQPGMVRSALAAIGPRAAHWGYVSSASVYATNDTPQADESAELLPAAELDVVDAEQYGEAKVACELAVLDAVGDRALLARSGLIAGPGDHTGRSGYWVARAARAPEEPMLVPDAPDAFAQMLDARDLAAWMVHCAEQRVVGSYNAVGPVMPFLDFVELSRQVGGHRGDVVLVPSDWLIAHDVNAFMGPESLALWLAEPGWEAFANRSGAAAAAHGLTSRPMVDLLTDLLAWEREQGLDRERRAGLSAGRERELLAAYAAESGR